MTIIKKILKPIILFSIGGTVYVFMELSFRGRSHIAMFFVGGLAFLMIGFINEIKPLKNLPLFNQSILGSLIVTFLELIFGYLLNIVLKLDVWDYSNLPFNFHGQICLPFSILWIFVSLFAIVLDDYIRYKLFDEEKPTYTFFSKHF